MRYTVYDTSLEPESYAWQRLNTQTNLFAVSVIHSIRETVFQPHSSSTSTNIAFYLSTNLSFAWVITAVLCKCTCIITVIGQLVEEKLNYTSALLKKQAYHKKTFLILYISGGFCTFREPINLFLPMILQSQASTLVH